MNVFYMKREIITLFPKKNKNQLILKNWRPISLLNTDYKILAKILANRLKHVLESIISCDQTGFITNRYIGENVRLFTDIIEYCKKNCVSGLALSIDFEKAFDYIEWNFLNVCLKAMGFKHEWINVMYINISNCVSNNGYS